MTRSESCALESPSLSGRRISALLELPKLCTANSPRFILSITLRTRARSAGWLYAISITVPPRKSTPRLRPRVARNNTASRKVTNEITLNTSACFMNGMTVRMRKNSMLILCARQLRRSRPQAEGSIARVIGPLPSPRPVSRPDRSKSCRASSGRHRRAPPARVRRRPRRTSRSVCPGSGPRRSRAPGRCRR